MPNLAASGHGRGLSTFTVVAHTDCLRIGVGVDTLQSKVGHDEGGFLNIECAQLDVGHRMVVRFWRWTPEELAKNARMGFTADLADGLAPTEYSVSVFAKSRRADETVSEFVERACVELRGARNSQWVALVPESDLVDAGFRIELNEPPVDHYDIPVGSSEETLRVDELSAVFGRYERRKVSK